MLHVRIGCRRPADPCDFPACRASVTLANPLMMWYHCPNGIDGPGQVCIPESERAVVEGTQGDRLLHPNPELRLIPAGSPP